MDRRALQLDLPLDDDRPAAARERFFAAFGGKSLPLPMRQRRTSRAEVGLGAGRLTLPSRWHDGVCFPFLGRTLVVTLDGRGDGIALAEDKLYLPLPPQAGERQIEDSVHGWLQAQARLVIGARLEAGCRHLGMPVPAWRLSYAAASRGGLGADGSLRLSWRLVFLSPEEIDRVVCRFLSQLRTVDATPALWESDAATLSA